MKPFYLIAIFIGGCFFSGCSKKEKLRSVNFVIICDDVSEDLVTALDSRLFKSEPYPLCDGVPEGFKAISFTVIPACENTRSLSIRFSEAENETKEPAASNRFIEELKTLKESCEVPGDYIRSIQKFLSMGIKSKEEYRVMILSDMIEKSGGSMVDQPSQWRDSKFIFTDGNGECNFDAINEAKRQLDSGNLFRNFIQEYVPLVKQSNIKVCIKGTGRESITASDECSARDIRDFWDSYFERLGLNVKHGCESISSFISTETAE